jgi:hypothetical protein
MRLSTRQNRILLDLLIERRDLYKGLVETEEYTDAKSAWKIRLEELEELIWKLK